MDEHAATAPGVDPVPSHAGLRYGALRIVLLLVVGALLYLVGMRSWPWLFTTVLVSAVLSFFVLLRQREAAARSLEASVSARRRKVGGSAADPDSPTAPPGDAAA